MTNLSNEKSIKDTLNLIRSALNDDIDIADKKHEQIVILNQLVKEDGTIQKIYNDNIEKEEIKKIFENKLSEIFEEQLEKWFDKNIPNYLEKYISKKNR